MGIIRIEDHSKCQKLLMMGITRNKSVIFFVELSSCTLTFEKEHPTAKRVERVGHHGGSPCTTNHPQKRMSEDQVDKLPGDSHGGDHWKCQQIVMVGVTRNN